MGILKHRVKWYPQLNARECGPACLFMLARSYGIKCSYQEIREICGVTAEGVSLEKMASAADSLGFDSQAVILSKAQIFNKANLPCIVHWDGKHYVIVSEIKTCRNLRYLKVLDPAIGPEDIPEGEFFRHWCVDETHIVDAPESGVALLIKAGSKYKTPGKMKSLRGLDYFHYYRFLKPHLRLLFKIALTMCVAAVFSLIIPVASQIAVDKSVNADSIGFAALLLAALLFLIVGKYINDAVRNVLFLRLDAKACISMVMSFLSDILHMPVDFWRVHKSGDLLQWVKDHDDIHFLLVDSIASLVLGVILLSIYGVTLFHYDGRIFFIFVIASALYIGWYVIFSQRIRKYNNLRFKSVAEVQNALIQLHSGVVDIKLNSFEYRMIEKWRVRQQKLLSVITDERKLLNVQQIGGVFFEQSRNLIISYLSSKLVVDGSVSIGVMTSIQCVLGQLGAPVNRIAGFINELQDAKMSMARVGVVRKSIDSFNSEKSHYIPCNGMLKLENVSFGYSEGRLALKNISLDIPNKKITAIVGASGSGKSTILKILLKLYPISEGRIFVGDTDSQEIDDSEWWRHCSCVVQNGFIFEDTISANIAMDSEICIERVRYAASVAELKDWIEGTPRKYETALDAGGYGLSAGQKQRILIARAVYKDAPFLFMDEPTNSLDSITEDKIMENLLPLFRQRTTIIITHNLRTIMNADNIVVVKDGQIIECGTHSELLNNNGEYYKMYKIQLR